MWLKVMGNEKGYILPFVLMLCTLLFFILSNQITLFVTEAKFYYEKKELYDIERMIQKSIKDSHLLVHDNAIQRKEIVYDEGSANFNITFKSPTLKIITITVHTHQNRKSTIILHYDILNHKIIRWIEGR